MFGKSSLLVWSGWGAGKRGWERCNLFEDSCKNLSRRGCCLNWVVTVGAKRNEWTKKDAQHFIREMQIKLQQGITSHMSGLLLAKNQN